MKKATRYRIVFYSIAIPIIALAFTIALPAFRRSHSYSGPDNRGECRAQMTHIGRGMERYRSDLGYYPTGSISAVFIMLSKDAKGHSYVGYSPTPLWRFPKWKDSFVDPWGSAYKIEIVNRTNALIHSAGANHTFGDEDDLVLDIAEEHFDRE